MIDDLATLATNVSFTSNTLIIDLPRRVDARAVIIKLENHFALWANLMGKKFAVVRSRLGEVRIPASLAVFDAVKGESMISTQFPGLYLGQEIKIYSSDFLRSLLDLLERKDSISGLVRLRDNAQLVLTHGSALSLGVTDASDYTRLRREDYWHLEDLADFNREWRQQLREDSSNSIEFTYRALDNPLDPNGDWVRCVSRYRLLKDGSELYHQAECLDFAPIPRPAITA